MKRIRAVLSRIGAAFATAWRGFTPWRRQRPFLGGVLIVASGIELFFSGQLDLGNIQLQFGIEGAQATILPIVLVVLGLLVLMQPAQRIFYGIVALAIALYSIIGVNLGGWIIGTLLGAVGGILAVAWLPRAARTMPDDPEPGDPEPGDSAQAVTPPFSKAPARGGASPRKTKAPVRAGRARGARRPMIAIGAALALSVTAIGAAPSSSQAVCLLGVLGQCSTASPTPTPSSGGGAGSGGAGSSGSGSSGSGSSGSGGLLGGLGSSGVGIPPITVNTPGSDGTSDGTGGVQLSPLETGIVIPLSKGVPAGTQLTNQSGALKAQTLSITGLSGLGLVNVPTAGGGHQAIEIDCADLVINGFSLAVTQDGNTLSNVASRMELRGDVQVFLTSVTADIGGVAAVYDLLHPPAQDANLSLLSAATIGLNGVIADQILFTGVDQRML